MLYMTSIATVANTDQLYRQCILPEAACISCCLQIYCVVRNVLHDTYQLSLSLVLMI